MILDPHMSIVANQVRGIALCVFYDAAHIIASIFVDLRLDVPQLLQDSKFWGKSFIITSLEI
jgi:hypothetical protein